MNSCDSSSTEIKSCSESSSFEPLGFRFEVFFYKELKIERQTVIGVDKTRQIWAGKLVRQR